MALVFEWRVWRSSWSGLHFGGAGLREHVECDVAAAPARVIRNKSDDVPCSPAHGTRAGVGGQGSGGCRVVQRLREVAAGCANACRPRPSTSRLSGSGDRRRVRCIGGQMLAQAPGRVPCGRRAVMRSDTCNAVSAKPAAPQTAARAWAAQRHSLAAHRSPAPPGTRPVPAFPRLRR